jgi:hypothetical protein
MNISTVLIGGFGNRLFQLANAFRLQKKYQCHLTIHKIVPKQIDVDNFRFLVIKTSDYDEFGGHEILKKEGLPHSIEEIFPLLDWNSETEDLSTLLSNNQLVLETNLTKLNNFVDSLVLGYFFPYTFVKDEIVTIKNNLNPIIFDYVNNNYNELNNRKILGIHLRMGINSDNTSAIIVPSEFYQYVLDELNDNYDMIYVLSDNILRAKEFITNFKIDKEIKYISDEPMYVDMIILSKCTYLAIAPSTLSAWAAYLSDSEKIYVPKIWLEHHWTEDIPEKWILL